MEEGPGGKGGVDVGGVEKNGCFLSVKMKRGDRGGDGEGLFFCFVVEGCCCF